MGFFGDFVLARSGDALAGLSVFGAEPACSEGHQSCVTTCWPRPGGWQTLQVHHGLPDGDNDRWLRALVAATGAPAAIANVMDSDVCLLSGLSPAGASWSTVLDPAIAAEYGISVPAARDLVERISAWAGEAGFAADRTALREVLAKRADPFAEDLFFELLDSCGLPASAPPPADALADSPAHRGHRPDGGGPQGGDLERAVLNLPRGGHLVLQCAADANCCAQVWLRPDGTYQLEYRDRAPAEHYQTRTVSVEKVMAALTGWTAGEIEWRGAFQWTSIGSQFDGTSVPGAT